MRDLIGQCFNFADGRYRIVDVRRLGGDAMVYAELLAPGAAPGAAAHDTRSDHHCGAAGRPGRTAFHFADIAAVLPTQQSA